MRPSDEMFTFVDSAEQNIQASVHGLDNLLEVSAPLLRGCDTLSWVIGVLASSTVQGRETGHCSVHEFGLQIKAPIHVSNAQSFCLVHCQTESCREKCHRLGQCLEDCRLLER